MSVCMTFPLQTTMPIIDGQPTAKNKANPSKTKRHPNIQLTTFFAPSPYRYKYIIARESHQHIGQSNISGFESPGFRIPQAKMIRIRESGRFLCMGRPSTSQILSIRFCTTNCDANWHFCQDIIWQFGASGIYTLLTELCSLFQSRTQRRSTWKIRIFRGVARIFQEGGGGGGGSRCVTPRVLARLACRHPGGLLKETFFSMSSGRGKKEKPTR